MRRPHRRLFVGAALTFLLTSSSVQAGDRKPGQQPPALQSPPVLTGTAAVGSTLTANPGTWTGSQLSFGYQWLRCDSAGLACAPIAGALTREYLVGGSDVGARLRVAVTASNKNGSQTAVSAPSEVVVGSPPTPALPPSNTSPPQISGTAQAGQTLSASTGSWAGAPISFAYQWKRCDAAGAGCQNVSGATASSYSLGGTDIGVTMRVAVTATNAVGSATATSNATPVVAAAEVPPPAPAPGRFGVSDMQFVYSDASARPRLFDQLTQIGAAWVRFDFAWSVIEPQRGQFSWARADAAVSEARARNVNVIASLVYAPAWANGGHVDDKYEPANPDDFARFAEAVARRYAPLGVKVYEIWNEPNLVNFWKPRPNVVKYTEMVRLSYARLKAVDPSAVVLAGAMSPVGGYDDANCDGVRGDAVRADGSINPVNFLASMYQNGVRGSFDALSHHPYEGAGFVDHPCSAWNQMAGTSPSLRSLMVANGDDQKKIWATEYGNTLAWVTEQGQATRLNIAFDLWLSYPWAGVMTYFNSRDNGELFGLVRSDWTQRPAWFAYRDHRKQ